MLNFGLVRLNAEFDALKPAFSNSYNEDRFSISGGLKVGLEKRKSVREPIQFIYGVDLQAVLSNTGRTTDNPNLPIELRTLHNTSVSTGLGFNLGFMLDLGKNFFVGAELTPSILYRLTTSDRLGADAIFVEKTSSIDLNISNQSVRLSAIYRWDR